MQESFLCNLRILYHEGIPNDISQTANEDLVRRKIADPGIDLIAVIELINRQPENFGYQFHPSANGIANRQMSNNLTHLSPLTNRIPRM
jgi:hypothetical protein